MIRTLVIRSTLYFEWRCVPTSPLFDSNLKIILMVGTKGDDIWVTLLIRIREVLGSNLGRDTYYPVLSTLWFYSVTPRKCQDRTSIGHGHFLVNPFQLIVDMLSYNSMLCSEDTDSVVKWHKRYCDVNAVGQQSQQKKNVTCQRTRTQQWKGLLFSI
jgi:hypothetical protein